MRLAAQVLAAGAACLLVACATPAARIRHIQLGMTPDQVREKVGDPYTTRAGKVYEDGRTTEVWEYIAKLAIYPKDYWVYFENGKVVQWGEPGDFSGQTQTDAPLSEYRPTRKN